MQYTEPVFLYVYGAPELIPRNEFRQPCSLAGRYDNPIPRFPPRFLAPIDFLKIPAQYSTFSCSSWILKRHWYLCFSTAAPLLNYTHSILSFANVTKVFDNNRLFTGSVFGACKMFSLVLTSGSTHDMNNRDEFTTTNNFLWDCGAALCSHRCDSWAELRRTRRPSASGWICLRSREAFHLIVLVPLTRRGPSPFLYV